MKSALNIADPEIRHAMRNIISLERGVVACLSEEEVLPSTILLWCWCDAMGAATARGQAALRGTGPKTKDWLTRYVVARLPDGVTAEELWSARHGTLHALTPMSDDVLHRGVRSVSWTIIEQHAEDARRRTAKISRTAEAHLTLSIEALVKALVAGTDECLAQITADAEWRKEFLQLAGNQYDQIVMPFGETNSDSGRTAK